MLESFAHIVHEGAHGHPGPEIAALLHSGVHVTRAQQQLHGMIRDLVAEGARGGAIRDDVASDELASFCLHSLSAAGGLPSKAAVRRLVSVTLAGLRPPH